MLADLTPREPLTHGPRPRALERRQVADELVVAEATVKTHVVALAQLHARDRVGAVVFAYEAGLVTPGAG